MASTAVLLAAGAAAGRAQAVRNGPEFQVNTTTSGDQVRPAIAVDANGGFVVTWRSTSPSDQRSIAAQPFTAGGQAVGGEIQVHGPTSNYQAAPAVAVEPGGDFVVVWGSKIVPGAGYIDPRWDIRARRYSSAGDPVGPSFLVNTYTLGYQRYPAVVSDAQGGFVVAWGGLGSPEDDTAFYSVQARRFGSDGNPLGDQFQVNSYTTGSQRDAAIVSLPGGEHLIVWSSGGSNGTDTATRSIQGRRFDAAWNPLGSELQVNTYTTADQNYPAVAADELGSVLVAWESNGSGGSDLDDRSIQARLFDPAGLPLGNDFQVNVCTTGRQEKPAIAVDTEGLFVVSWLSSCDGGGFPTQSIQARRYDAAGGSIGSEFRVNTDPAQSAWIHDVASDPDGNFVVAWTSYHGSPGDESAEILAQRFDQLFRDGFESGDASRWSGTAP